MANYLDTPVGIHRLMRAPYDDREVFDNVDNLLAYCRDGAFYSGQKVAVKFPTYIQNYTIFVGGGKAYPIIELPPGYEWHLYNNDNTTNKLLVYCSINSVWPEESRFTRFYSCDQWAIMDSVKCINNNPTFTIITDTPNSAISTSEARRQSLQYNDTTCTAPGIILFNSNADSNTRVEVYIEEVPTEYLKALGVK